MMPLDQGRTQDFIKLSYSLRRSVATFDVFLHVLVTKAFDGKWQSSESLSKIIFPPLRSVGVHKDQFIFPQSLSVMNDEVDYCPYSQKVQ
jgi:hypothetical protein